MTISDKIKEIRRNNNLTQDEFADKLMISRQTVSKWENNQASPDLENIRIICEIFHVTPNDLFEIYDDENSKNKRDLQQNIKKIKGLFISLGIAFLALTGLFIWLFVNPSNKEIIVLERYSFIGIFCIFVGIIIVILLILIGFSLRKLAKQKNKN